MSFNKIISQPQAVRRIQNAMSRGRLAHAYVLCGPDGVGKALFARELAKALLCETGDVDNDACDECKRCRTVEAGKNPDLSWFSAEYKAVKIDVIQELARLAAIKPFEAGRRVFVIEEAEKMTADAANCLLKTLEEPPPGVVILLITTSLMRLPRTIISRCQTVRFYPLDADAARRLIAENPGVEGRAVDELEWLARASCGSMGRAACLIEEQAVPRRQKLLERLFSLHMEDNFSIAEELLNWCSPKEKEEEGLEGKRSRLRLWFYVMLEYYRDILLCKVGAGEIGLFNSDVRDKIEAKAGRISEGAVEKIVEEIQYALDGLQRNANLNLLVENMFTRIARLEE